MRDPDYVSRKVMDRYQDAFRRKFSKWQLRFDRHAVELSSLRSQISILQIRLDTLLEYLESEGVIWGGAGSSAEGGSGGNGR